MVKLEEIEIDKIDIRDNIRLESNAPEDVSFMENIKNEGLLNPIGVVRNKDRFIFVFGSRRLKAFKKLGYKKIPALVEEYDANITEEDMIVKNTIENVQRKDVSPYELGRICCLLQKKGLTSPEISVRLGLAVSQIKGAIQLFNLNLDEKDKKEVIKGSGSKQKHGKITVTSMNRIARISTKLSSENAKNYVQAVKENQLTEEKIIEVNKLIEYGMPYDKAMQEMANYTVVHLNLIVDKNRWAMFKLKNKKFKQNELFMLVCMGKLQLPNNFFYYNKKGG